jgi:hypothetical protein
VIRAALPWPGDIGIRALVRARLLGLRLLTLDAHIVVGRQHADVTSPAFVVRVSGPGEALAGSFTEPPVPKPAPPRPVPGPGERSTARARPVPGPESGSRLARAALLLEQGAEALEHSRDPAFS